MTDLETRLAADLIEAAHTAPLRPPDREAVAASVAHRRRVRRARNTALAVAASVVVAAAAVAALGAFRDDDHVQVDEPTTTTTTTTPSSSTTPTPSTTSATTAPDTSPGAPGVPISETLVLRPDGFGPLDFGTAQDEVMARVVAELGEPRARYQGGGPGQGCEPAAEEVAWIGLILTFEGPDTASLRLTAWSAGIGNPEAPSNYRVADGGPALGDPIEDWQATYGSAFQLETMPGSGPGYRAVTINLERGILQGSAGPEDPIVVNGLGARTSDCTLGD